MLRQIENDLVIEEPRVSREQSSTVRDSA